MIEIKFRQWHDGKFYYWGIGIKGATFTSPTMTGGCAIESPHEQFTGLKDKNGNEIFEGDTISAVFMSGYSSGYSRYWSKPITVERGNKADFYPLNKCEWWVNDKTGNIDYIVVVGNIHENVDLLNA